MPARRARWHKTDDERGAAEELIAFLTRQPQI
jgi:hypothetical protein